MQELQDVRVIPTFWPLIQRNVHMIKKFLNLPVRKFLYSRSKLIQYVKQRKGTRPRIECLCSSIIFWQMSNLHLPKIEVFKEDVCDEVPRDGII